MHNDFDQWRLSRPPDFAQKVGLGTKHATPNHSYSTRKWKGSAGQNQSSSDTDQQRTANTHMKTYKPLTSWCVKSK